ncbi:MAG: replicative DNA helicase [Actinomycetota bacterium]
MATSTSELQAVRERVPPHNEGAEQSVLGAMMLSGEAIAAVLDAGLKSEDFYRSAHRAVFDGLTMLYARGEPVDAVTSVEELRRRGTLDSAGGALYIQHLVEAVATPASANHYARIVADHALLRRLIHAAGEILQGAYEVPEDPEGFADEAEGRIYSVSRHHEQDEIVALGQLVHRSLEDLERLQDRTGLVGLPTGFRDLDELLQGLQRANLLLVAARPGVGKSSFVTNVARNVAVAGTPVAMFSLEMSQVEIGMRLLCAEARVAGDKVRANRVAAEDWGRIVEAAETLDKAPLYIVDSGNTTIVDIRAKARRLKSRENLGLIIVDYLQLMSSHRRVDNRQQEIAEISRSLKLLAKELDIPVIAVSQLNRDPERRVDKRPQLADLRECVTGDTLVSLTDGRRVPIAQLEGMTPEVWAVTPEGRLVGARSDKVWRVGRRPVFRIRLASGREIRATARHRLLGAGGWVRVGDLRVGDRVAIARRIPEPKDAVEWPEDRVALLGQLIGDGSYLVHQPLRYTTASEENSELVTRAATREFGNRVTRYRGRRTWHQLLISGNGNRWHPTGVNRWLRELGIYGQRSHEKRIPREAFRLSNRQIALLLRHLWATDGSISTRKEGSRGGAGLYFSTNSRGLADDVAALLLRIEIVGRISRVAKPGYRPWYHVAISGSLNQRRFLDVVGSFGPRAAPAARLRAVLEARGQGTNVDTLPREVGVQIRDLVSERGLSLANIGALRNVTMTRTSLAFDYSPSRELVAEYADILDSEALWNLATSDLFWDQVLSVTPDGEEEVYDLTVPGPASWFADSVTCHNSGSLEQDADVVMFIHREDVYSDDPSVKGMADVVVAKHRNGPIDKVRLTFLSHLTQFKDYSAAT